MSIYHLWKSLPLFARNFDRQKDIEDLATLKVSFEEIQNALDYTITKDAHPLWPKHCDEMALKLKIRLGYE